MKKLLILPLLALLMGCASFSTNTFRTEQTAVNLVYTAYVGYTNAIPVLHLTPDQSNAVKVARMKFAASVGVLEGWRSAYETNSAVKPQLQAALDALTDQSSNFVWLVTYLRSSTH